MPMGKGYGKGKKRKMSAAQNRAIKASEANKKKKNAAKKKRM